VLDTVGVLTLTVTLLWGSVREADSLRNGHPLLRHPGAPGYGLVLVACLVLLGCRRWPAPVFIASLAAVVLYTGLGYVDGAVLIAPMIALYHAAASGTGRRALVLGSVALSTLLPVDMAAEPFGLLGGSVTVLPFMVVASTFLGLAVANRRAYVAEIQDRAERAERSKEAEARRRVDAERLRIARELHDVVAHTISVINIQARVATQVILDPPQAGAEALAAIKDASAEALHELRTMLSLLRQADEAPPTDPPGGLDQLEILISAATRAGLAVDLSVSGRRHRLPPTVDLAAYRIVQESLTNVLRHAGPARARISIDYGCDGVVVRVDDDGWGVAVRPSTESSSTTQERIGYGILGMRERAQAVGGTIEAGPGPVGGFQVRATLPLSR
jgi:signal transduction histidine kinase